METVQCNICSSSKARKVEIIAGFTLVKCLSCGLHYLNPRPDEMELEGLYEAEYHENKIIKETIGTAADIERQIEANRSRAEEIDVYADSKGHVLDFGCSAGFFLAAMRRLGWETTGYDASAWAIEIAREHLDITVYNGILNDAFAGRQFDAITLFHVLEHLTDPKNTLAELKQLLKPAGMMILRGPNYGSMDRVWHGKRWHGYQIPYHLYHFSKRDYQRLFREAGLRITKITQQNWNFMDHLIEARLGDAWRGDHSSREISKQKQLMYGRYPVLKISRRLSTFLGKLLRLNGRDITIYATHTD